MWASITSYLKFTGIFQMLRVNITASHEGTGILRLYFDNTD